MSSDILKNQQKTCGPFAFGESSMGRAQIPSSYLLRGSQQEGVQLGPVRECHAPTGPPAVLVAEQPAEEGSLRGLASYWEYLG